MLKWIVVLGVCALLAACDGSSDAQKVAEFEKTVEALSTKYPRTDRCGGDPECWAYWADQAPKPDNPDPPDEEDWPYVK